MKRRERSTTPSASYFRPIYSLQPMLADILWRRELMYGGLLEATLTTRNVSMYDAIHGRVALSVLCNLPNSDRVKRFAATLPKIPSVRAPKPEWETYEKALQNAYIAEVERLGTPRADNETVLQGAQRGILADIQTMWGVCSGNNDEAGVTFWTIVKRIVSIKSYEIAMRINVEKLAKYQLGKCATEINNMGIVDTRNVASIEILYYRTVNNRAIAAIGMWLRVGIRWRVVKDIRRVIAQILWSIRHEWSY